MIIVRFKLRCRPERTEEVKAALADVIAPSRELPGVVSLDIAQTIDDPDAFIATEIYDDRAALARQEALPEVEQALALIRESLADKAESTIFHISSSEQFGSQDSS